jgi:flagellar biosynthesis chaperone FliJ
MNTLDKQFFTNCVLRRHDKMQRFLAKKLDMVQKVHDNVKNELNNFNNEKDKYINALQQINDVSNAYH